MTRCHDCDDKILAAAEETVCRDLILAHCLQKIPALPNPHGTKWLEAGGRALDVGAGTSGVGRRILEGWDYTGIDPYLKPDKENNIFGGDILRGPFIVANESYDLILCKRALCQMNDVEVSHAVANMLALLRPGGHLLVCEPWRAEREALCAARALPDPESGGRGVPELVGAITPLADVPVAPNYVLWTRYAQPMFHPIWGQSEKFLRYDDPRREIYPAFPPEVQNRFAFYRARLWRKVP